MAEISNGNGHGGGWLRLPMAALGILVTLVLATGGFIVSVRADLAKADADIEALKGTAADTKDSIKDTRVAITAVWQGIDKLNDKLDRVLEHQGQRP